MPDIQILYHSLTGEIIGDLFKYLVFFGFFGCCMALVWRSLLDTSWPRSADFFRHFAMMSCITLFTTYIALTYGIENYQSIQTGNSESNRIESIRALMALKGAEWNQARLLLLTMLPIDLLGLALNTSLFAIIIWTASNRENWNGRNITTIRTVMLLFSAAALWHLVTVFWWLTYFGLSGSGGSIFEDQSTRFHLMFATVDVALAFSLFKLLRSTFALRRSSLLANAAACCFCLNFLILYGIRLWDYSNRFRNIFQIGDL